MKKLQQTGNGVDKKGSDNQDNARYVKTEKMSENKESENDELESEEGNDQKKVCCPHCEKTFSKTANMNAHIKSSHKGHRWVCYHEECAQECSTKASLKRHIERMHTSKLLRGRKGNRRVVATVDLTEREYFGDDELTDKAKMMKIRRLENELKLKDEEIQKLKKINERLNAENEKLKTTINKSH